MAIACRAFFVDDTNVCWLVVLMMMAMMMFTMLDRFVFAALNGRLRVVDDDVDKENRVFLLDFVVALLRSARFIHAQFVAVLLHQQTVAAAGVWLLTCFGQALICDALVDGEQRRISL